MDLSIASEIMLLSNEMDIAKEKFQMIEKENEKLAEENKKLDNENKKINRENKKLLQHVNMLINQIDILTCNSNEMSAKILTLGNETSMSQEISKLLVETKRLTEENQKLKNNLEYNDIMSKFISEQYKNLLEFTNHIISGSNDLHNAIKHGGEKFSQDKINIAKELGIKDFVNTNGEKYHYVEKFM